MYYAPTIGHLGKLSTSYRSVFLRQQSRKLREVETAKELFNHMPQKNPAAFNAMIDAFVKSGNVDSARKLFNEMPERNVVSWMTLIYGYCKNANLQAARLLFNAMPEKNLISWIAIIGGYCQKISNLKKR
ncbi:hypothetical protein NE237_030792 [Protea cynaroides]|uniref:Pentatricopeptide repeat-containing protein n=1 Tax=Protea cynaroides TaxID=273540 RepID=A0A9Q0JXB0_9MAGN|nr:hypothetical protein NE237_030792 [Protea cynaroides]